MHKRLGGGVLAPLALSFIVLACGGGSGSTAQTGGGAPTATPGAATSTAGGGSGSSPATGGAAGFEGSLATSKLYTATWTVTPGTEANPMNASNNPTLTSDKGTFGNVRVEIDGSIHFGSAAPELNANSVYDGTGAAVTLDVTGQFVCAFTTDTDLKGNHDGAILHLSGGLTVHWHPGAGLDCP